MTGPDQEAPGAPALGWEGRGLTRASCVVLWPWGRRARGAARHPHPGTLDGWVLSALPPALRDGLSPILLLWNTWSPPPTARPPKWGVSGDFSARRTLALPG